MLTLVAYEIMKEYMYFIFPSAKKCFYPSTRADVKIKCKLIYFKADAAASVYITDSQVSLLLLSLTQFSNIKLKQFIYSVIKYIIFC